MTGARRAAIAVAAAAAVVVVGVVAWRVADDGGSPATSGRSGVWLRDTGPARAPFESSTAGSIQVGRRTLSVVIADSDIERSAGLRGRTDASPYDGMLFVFPGDTRTPFTMSGVPAALDIGFYAADGSEVDRLRMVPCSGTDATCPVYRALGDFRYALETAPDELPAGRLRIE